MSEAKSKKRVTLAERLLVDMRDTQGNVSLYLVNGFQMKGRIVEFDQEAILFKLKDAHQLVMRSAVASMYPIRDSRGDTNEWWRSYGPGSS